ncbi:hypothetical protein KSP40_PGU018756 [Platanthera guangdongensis]|uniref:Uncharacterized protein n=1 Tax=Platanthera guangdongensis TaxID=2320717 RepID=A0ABR2LWG7_9ASPA
MAYPYDIENSKYLVEVSRVSHLAEDETIEEIKKRGMLKSEFTCITYAKLFMYILGENFESSVTSQANSGSKSSNSESDISCTKRLRCVWCESSGRTKIFTLPERKRFSLLKVIVVNLHTLIWSPKSCEPNSHPRRWPPTFSKEAAHCCLEYMTLISYLDIQVTQISTGQLLPATHIDISCMHLMSAITLFPSEKNNLLFMEPVPSGNLPPGFDSSTCRSV